MLLDPGLTPSPDDTIPAPPPSFEPPTDQTDWGEIPFDLAAPELDEP